MNAMGQNEVVQNMLVENVGPTETHVSSIVMVILEMIFFFCFVWGPRTTNIT